MRTWTYVITLSLLLPLFSHAQDIYTWVDKNGVIHFSEYTPPNSASKKEKVQMPDVKASAPAPVVLSAKPIDERKPVQKKQPAASEEKLLAPAASSDMNAKQKEKKSKENKRLEIKITTPTNTQTIRSNRGLITIVLEANRSLKPGEHYQLIMNEKRYGAPKTENSWDLKNIDRGTHAFSVNALQSGKVIASTNTIKVHLHRNSVKK